MRRTPRTLIEFVEPVPEGSNAEDAVAHKMRVVHINGQEVLVERDSIDLTFGPDEITKVTLTIIPTEVRFIAKESTK